ncbi:hypothetical protein Ancab_036009 [Ancistrocladus abbreviatus]
MITIERKDRDWLRGCLVGEIKSITMLEGLKAEMENEGIRGYRLQPMGGNLVLISTMGASSVVESVERDRQLLERWFKIIRPWKETNKLPLMKQRNDEVQTMEEDPTAQRLPFNLGKINAEFSEANSRPKSQGTAQAEECDVNKCCSYCKKYNADLAFVEKADNSAGLELRAIMGQGPKLFIAPKPVLEDGLIQQNFENQEEMSPGDLVDQKPIKQSPVNTFAKEKTEGEPESTKARRCTVGNEESKRKAWR